MPRVCVFCGSSDDVGEKYRKAAAALGAGLARRGLGLVYGGASVGLMGVLADAALREGGEVIGVIPRRLEEREIAHQGLSELHVVGDMHARKALMAQLSDGFIALPGGLGTLEELFEVLTWAYLRFHSHPCAVLDVDGFYASLRSFLDHATTEGFIRESHRELLLWHESVDTVLDAMRRKDP